MHRMSTPTPDFESFLGQAPDHQSYERHRRIYNTRSPIIPIFKDTLAFLDMLRLTVIVCLVAAAAGSDPKCETGIEDADKQVCCAKSCGKCGGEDCQAHPGEQHSFKRYRSQMGLAVPAMPQREGV